MWAGVSLLRMTPSPGIPGALVVLLHDGAPRSLGVIRVARGSRWIGDPSQQTQRSGWDFTGQARFGERAPGEQMPGTRPACFSVCTMGSWCGQRAPPPWTGGHPNISSGEHRGLGWGGWGHTEHIEPRP